MSWRCNWPRCLPLPSLTALHPTVGLFAAGARVFAQPRSAVCPAPGRTWRTPSGSLPDAYPKTFRADAERNRPSGCAPGTSATSPSLTACTGRRDRATIGIRSTRIPSMERTGQSEPCADESGNGEDGATLKKAEAAAPPVAPAVNDDRRSPRPPATPDSVGVGGGVVLQRPPAGRAHAQPASSPSWVTAPPLVSTIDSPGLSQVGADNTSSRADRTTSITAVLSCGAAASGRSGSRVA